MSLVDITPQHRQMRIQDWMKQALEHCQGTHTLDDVLDGLREGRTRLWEGRSTMAVTEIVQFPQRRALSMFLAAGRHEEMAENLPGLRSFGRGAGCDAMMFMGKATRRSAWEKLLPGMRVTHECLWEDI